MIAESVYFSQYIEFYNCNLNKVENRLQKPVQIKNQTEIWPGLLFQIHSGNGRHSAIPGNSYSKTFNPESNTLHDVTSHVILSKHGKPKGFA